MALRSVQTGEQQESFPAVLPETDRARWYSMTPKQRIKVTKRLEAITAWHDGELDIVSAIDASGLSRSRFYTVAARWREAPSLASLGGFAGAGGARAKLNPDVINALQAVIAEVYAVNKGASVHRLMQLMVEASGVAGDDLPGIQRRRAIVEAEIRRSEATGQAGHALKGDISAINLARENGRPHIIYALIDEGTRLILGAWTQGELDEVSGYRGAARDAQQRLTTQLGAISWTDRLMRIELKVRDAGAAQGMRDMLLEGGVSVRAQGSPKGYGKYFRKLIGTRIGRVEITPARTEAGSALTDNRDLTPWSDDAARASVAQAVDEYNASVLGSSDIAGRRKLPPDDLIKALSVLAG